MLSVNGLTFEILYRVVERVNKTLQQNDQVTIALVNGVRNFVISGKEDSLKVLLSSLQQIQAKVVLILHVCNYFSPMKTNHEFLSQNGSTNSGIISSFIPNL